MDVQTLLWILIVFVAVAAIALVLQLATLLGMFLALKKVQGLVTQVWPEIQAIIGVSRRTVEKAETHIDKIGAAGVAIMDVTKQRVGKVDEFVNDLTMRSRVQVERAEMVLDDT